MALFFCSADRSTILRSEACHFRDAAMDLPPLAVADMVTRCAPIIMARAAFRDTLSSVRWSHHARHITALVGPFAGWTGPWGSASAYRSRGSRRVPLHIRACHWRRQRALDRPLQVPGNRAVGEQVLADDYGGAEALHDP